MLHIFLAQVSEDSATSFVVMQVDSAGWHLSHDLTIPEKSRLIFQPPSRPEVNSVEHLWEERREKQRANQMFSSLDDLRALMYFPPICPACEIAT